MKRELMEEALNSLQMTEQQLEDYKTKLHEFFSGGVEVSITVGFVFSWQAS